MSLLLASCSNTVGAVWEDTKTVGRYLNHKGRLMLGVEEINVISASDTMLGPMEEEFIPLDDHDLKVQHAEYTAPQTVQNPLIKAASDSSYSRPEGTLAKLLKSLHFKTDVHTLHDQADLISLDAIASYLKINPKVSLFIEGHCDERASETYNLALGTRRANYVRSQLIKKGVSANRLFAISLGKEIPVDGAHTKAAWAKNRRVEFKVYEKN